MKNQKRNAISKMIRRLVIALIITLSIAIGELAGGLLSNSLALLGDAGHMMVDALAISMSIIAFRLARRPPTPGKTFGLLRSEILAALANGAILFFVALFLIYEGIKRLDSPPVIEAEIMLPVAVAGFLANIAGASILKDHAKRNLNVKGAFYHMLSDAASSMAVIAGGTLIILTGKQIIDPIMSFLVAALILRGSFLLLSQSVNILVEAVPPHIDLERLKDYIEKIPEISEIHDLHVWTITSGVYALSGHIVLDDKKVSECQTIIQKVNEILREKFNIQHSTWQLESEPCMEELSCRLNEIR